LSSTEYKTPSRPLLEWSKEEAKQYLLQSNNGMFASIADKLDGINGKTLVDYTKEDLVVITGSPSLGIALFNNLQLNKRPQGLDPTVLSDRLLPWREAPDWDHLRDLNILRNKIGQVIQLPNLSGTSNEWPKEMNEKKIERIFLTEQRFKLVEEFWSTCRIGQRDVPLPIEKDSEADRTPGMVLSGPNGVSKTVASYLLACVAYVNSCILFYCVCSILSFFLFFFSNLFLLFFFFLSLLLVFG